MQGNLGYHMTTLPNKTFPDLAAAPPSPKNAFGTSH